MECVKVLRPGDEKVSLEFLITECIDGIDTVVDITTTDVRTIHFTKTDVNKTQIDKSGVIFTGGTNGDGTDGIVQYVVETGFVVDGDGGKWTAQATVEFASGGIFNSSVVKITVKENTYKQPTA